MHDDVFGNEFVLYVKAVFQLIDTSKADGRFAMSFPMSVLFLAPKLLDAIFHLPSQNLAGLLIALC